MKALVPSIIVLLSFSAIAEQAGSEASPEKSKGLGERKEAIEKELEQSAASTIVHRDLELKVFGMRMARGPKGNRVSMVIENSPADHAGVRPGDLLVEVDGEDVTSLSVNETLGKLATKNDFAFVFVPKQGGEKWVEMEKTRQGDFVTETGSFRLVDDWAHLLEIGIGDVAPDFPARDKDGNRVRLHELNNKTVIVHFTATWCAPCTKELPSLLQFYKEHRSKNFEIVSVFVDEDSSAVERYVEKNQIPWPFLAGDNGWDTEIVREYGLRSIPTMALIVDGRIVKENVRAHLLEGIVPKHLVISSRCE
ncbi:MAG: redoxin family protein [Verrucomicrobiota bacterium]